MGLHKISSIPSTAICCLDSAITCTRNAVVLRQTSARNNVETVKYYDHARSQCHTAQAFANLIIIHDGVLGISAQSSIIPTFHHVSVGAI